jgi:hypothetical protein
VIDPERYWDAPDGDGRRSVVRSAALDVPSSNAMSKTLVALGLDGPAPPSPAAPRRLGRWVAGGIAGIALLGGWMLRPSKVAIEHVEPPLTTVVVTAPAAAEPESPVASAVPVETMAPSIAASSAPAGEKRREPSDDLGAQLAIIDAARGLLAQGSTRDALARLHEYDVRYPGGALALEATALRVEALLRSGDRTKGQALGERFVARHPNSPYAARIRSLLTQTP